MTLGRSVFALALFGAATAASAAMAGPLDTMFGNTVVVTLPNKAQV
jgi:hypothetical protein